MGNGGGTRGKAEIESVEVTQMIQCKKMMDLHGTERVFSVVEMNDTSLAPGYGKAEETKVVVVERVLGKR